MNKNIDNTKDAIEQHIEMESFTKNLQLFGITKVHTTIQQSPNADNGHVAVCQTELASSGKSVSMPGFATPETSMTDQAQVLLFGCGDGFAKMRPTRHHKPSNLSPSRRRRESGEKAPYAPSQGQNAGERPITDGQRQFIQGLARKAGKAPDALAQSMTGKPLSQCNTVEASGIIKRLNRSDSQENDAVPW